MKKIFAIILFSVLAVLLSACTQADIVQYNLRREAEDFNIRRRITVLNTRTDKAMMQITGLLSISTDDDGDLNITIQKAPGEFVLNYAHLSNDTTYMVEQIETMEVNKYQYEIIFYPKQLICGLTDYQLRSD